MYTCNIYIYGIHFVRVEIEYWMHRVNTNREYKHTCKIGQTVTYFMHRYVVCFSLLMLHTYSAFTKIRSTNRRNEQAHTHTHTHTHKQPKAVQGQPTQNLYPHLLFLSLSLSHTHIHMHTYLNTHTHSFSHMHTYLHTHNNVQCTHVSDLLQSQKSHLICYSDKCKLLTYT